MVWCWSAAQVNESPSRLGNMARREAIQAVRAADQDRTWIIRDRIGALRDAIVSQVPDAHVARMHPVHGDNKLPCDKFLASIIPAHELKTPSNQAPTTNGRDSRGSYVQQGSFWVSCCSATSAMSGSAKLLRYRVG